MHPIYLITTRNQSFTLTSYIHGDHNPGGLFVLYTQAYWHTIATCTLSRVLSHSMQQVSTRTPSIVHEDPRHHLLLTGSPEFTDQFLGGVTGEGIVWTFFRKAMV